MISILVTGAGGFIGRRVVLAAVNAGFRVISLVRKPQGRASQHVIERDLCFPLTKLPPFDWIFHLAGAYAGTGDQELRQRDLAMANHLLAWGLAVGVENWIFASAAEVYGDIHGIAAEDALTEPVIPYGRIKLLVERLLIEKTQEISSRRVVILRIGEVYGANSRLITELTARLRRGFCPWPGKGDVPLSFVHVDDVAQAFMRAAQSASPGVSVYNVADNTPATWHGFLLRVAQLCKAKPPVFLPKALVHLYALACTLASRATGLEPVLTRHAVRLITTPKVLSNSCLRRQLGFQPYYPGYSEGLEEVFHGLSHHAQDGEKEGGPSGPLAANRHLLVR